VLEIIYPQIQLLGTASVLPDFDSEQFSHLSQLLPKTEQAHSMQVIYEKVCKSLNTEISYYQENMFRFAYYQLEENTDGVFKPKALILMDEEHTNVQAQGYAVVNIGNEFEYVEFNGNTHLCALEDVMVRMRIDICLALLKLYENSIQLDQQVVDVSAQISYLQRNNASVFEHKDELWQHLRHSLQQLIRPA